jgi:hypothetical protein
MLGVDFVVKGSVRGGARRSMQSVVSALAADAAIAAAPKQSTCGSSWSVTNLLALSRAVPQCDEDSRWRGG